MADPVAFDPKELESKVKAMYRSVAENPDGEFHFEGVGPSHGRAPRLRADLNHIPKESISRSQASATISILLISKKVKPSWIWVAVRAWTHSSRRWWSRTGKSFGVNMTDEQRAKAGRLRDRDGLNMTYVKAYIENFPAPAASVDVVISNGVIDLVDKSKVFSEAVRLLKSGGRFAISNICGSASRENRVQLDAMGRLHWRSLPAGQLSRPR